MKSSNIINTAIISVLTLSSNIALAATPAEKGLQIAQEADARDLGWGDNTADMKMLLVNKQGDTSEREIRVRTLEVEGDGDKSLTIFDKPKDVRGTAFLTFSHVTGADDQWLYLPALKRVKRISSRNKSGPFMGSEFAYEDMSSQEVGKYTYKYLNDENCGPQNTLNCFVMERYPVDEFSGYTKQVIWIDQNEYRAWKVDFYDRKKSLLKTLSISDYQQYLDKYWRAHTMEMQNHQTGKKSILTWSNYQFKTGLSESDFNKANLKRVR